jgi:hypothetical protein
MMPRNQPEESTTPAESVDAVCQNPRIPPFTPQKAARWIVAVERYFTTAKINNDAVKFSYVHANLTNEEQDVVDDILCNPKADYETLKREILKRFIELNNVRIQRFLESGEMGDRTPSQFYRHLLKLATPDVSESRVLTLWKRRLPLPTQ